VSRHRYRCYSPWAHVVNWQILQVIRPVDIPTISKSNLHSIPSCYGVWFCVILNVPNTSIISNTYTKLYQKSSCSVSSYSLWPFTHEANITGHVSILDTCQHAIRQNCTASHQQNCSPNLVAAILCEASHVTQWYTAVVQPRGCRFARDVND
jgi:hypothetical protein